MNIIQSILMGLGGDLPGFDSGIITGASIVLIVLICVFVISRIIEEIRLLK